MDRQQLKGLVAMVAEDGSALERLDPHQRDLVEAYIFGKEEGEEEGSTSVVVWAAGGSLLGVMLTTLILLFFFR